MKQGLENNLMSPKKAANPKWEKFKYYLIKIIINKI